MPEKTEIPVMSLTGVTSEINKGLIRIPDFQRYYIWTSEQVLELLDSIWNGYPIGSILLWKTNQILNEQNPLNLKLKELPEGAEKLYLLDGQQRLVTIYAVLHNILELGKKRKIKYRVYFDLKNKEFQIYKKKDLEGNKEVEPKIKEWFLPLDELMTIDYNTRTFSQNNEVIDKFSKNSDLLKVYVDLFIKFNALTFPAITSGQSLPIATKIFERLNNTGTPLTIVDLMVATTYTTKFNLRDNLSDLIYELDTNNYAIPERVILQCMSACLKKGVTRDDIINSSQDIEKKWKQTTQSLKLAIDFLKKHCSVPTSRFIPNNIILASLSYFFYKKLPLQVSPKILKKLKRYFWLSVLSERYNQSQDTKIEEDIINMDKISTDEGLFNYPVKMDWNIIRDTDLSFGSSFSCALMCFLCSKNPLEFKNNEKINLDQTFGEANQKQLHHIFPINFLKKKLSGKPEHKKEIKPYINSVANISLISRVTNRNIWNKKPSLYFKEFEKENKSIEKSLNSHLIGDLDEVGITKDNFPLFIKSRSKLIAEEINKLVKELKES